MLNTAVERDRLRVVAAVIRQADGRVLLARRPASKYQGGLWEFPGGKVETGESLSQALRRELAEELGLQLLSSRPFLTLDHDYPELSVRLYFREVLRWRGEAHGREGQAVNWWRPEQLQQLDFPAANRVPLTALALPDQLLILPQPLPPDWQQRLHTAITRGATLVYLRGLQQQPALLQQAQALCRAAGARTLLGNDVQGVQDGAADGLHLSAAAAAACRQRPPVPLLSVACHDAAELAVARRLQADMMLLSPVRPTTSHRQRPALGWAEFARLALGQPMVVYALGGMRRTDLRRARNHGARGVAGISGFFGAT